jgi:hypothetical protein
MDGVGVRGGEWAGRDKLGMPSSTVCKTWKLNEERVAVN